MSYVGNLTLREFKYGGTRPAEASLMDLVMANITIAQVEACTGATLVSGSRSSHASGVSIDSRTARHGDLFFAIRGPRRDGHNYLSDALSQGAAGAVVAADYDPGDSFPADRVLLKVPDTHQALKDLAADVRSRWMGSLVGITGSMGKTTAKEFSAHVLQTEFSVYRSPGNFNNLFGLPLALCELSGDDHIGIFEMGMSAPGEIAEMCRIARPSVGVITNVAPVHLEFFSGIEQIARAKGELAAGLGTSGTLVYNADDPLVAQIGAGFPGRRLSFGAAVTADVRASEIEVVSLRETRFRITVAGRSCRAAIPFAGWHYVMNTLPAVALATFYGLSPEQVIPSLRDLPQSPLRGQVFDFREGFTVIDDSYNSNPRALRQLIETVCALPCTGRRILAAGEMLELGPAGAALHYDCGAFAARSGFDIVVAIRGLAREIARGAVENGMPPANVFFFTEVAPATDLITRAVRSGDLVLVKGSRGVQLDRMVRSLRSTFEEWRNS